MYDFDLCEFLEITVETTTDAGMGNGSATATVTGGAEPYSIAWFEGDSEDSFADGMSVDSLLAGEYAVLAVDSTGCIGNADFVIDAVDGLTTPDVVWNVFPNPTADMLTLDVQHIDVDAYTIAIFDASGKQVYTANHAGINSRVNINLSSFESGTYLLNLISNKQETLGTYQVVRK